MLKRIGELLLLLVLGVVVGTLVIRVMESLHEEFVCEEWREKMNAHAGVIGGKCYIMSEGELYRPE